MRVKSLILVAAIAGVTGLAGCTQKTASTTPTTDEDKTLYALGVILSRNIQSFDFTEKELEMVKAGVSDGARDKSQLDDKVLEEMVPKLQELQTQRMAAATEKEKATGTEYLAKAAAEQGATKTASGLVIKTVQEGTGASPVASDTVKVHYTGKFVDGKEFDSSVKRNEPATFPLAGVIPCWSEAVQLMKVGGKAHVVCPPELAYGDEGRPPMMRGGATLVFDVELLDIVKPEAEGEAPAAPQKQ